MKKGGAVNERLYKAIDSADLETLRVLHGAIAGEDRAVDWTATNAQVMVKSRLKRSLEEGDMRTREEAIAILQDLGFNLALTDLSEELRLAAGEPADNPGQRWEGIVEDLKRAFKEKYGRK